MTNEDYKMQALFGITLALDRGDISHAQARREVKAVESTPSHECACGHTESNHAPTNKNFQEKCAQCTCAYYRDTGLPEEPDCHCNDTE